MKVFLLIERDGDDHDSVVGVFSSRESAELVNERPPVYGCAEILELELDRTYFGGA